MNWNFGPAAVFCPPGLDITLFCKCYALVVLRGRNKQKNSRVIWAPSIKNWEPLFLGPDLVFLMSFVRQVKNYCLSFYILLHFMEGDKLLPCTGSLLCSRMQSEYFLRGATYFQMWPISVIEHSDNKGGWIQLVYHQNSCIVTSRLLEESYSQWIFES